MEALRNGLRRIYPRVYEQCETRRSEIWKTDQTTVSEGADHDNSSELVTSSKNDSTDTDNNGDNADVRYNDHIDDTDVGCAVDTT